MTESRAYRRALALALFLTVWGARLVVVERFGSDLPFWDQWDKEGDKLYAEWFEHRDAKHLFLPHNEHRILPTLSLNLVLVLASGQWDARVQCAISAALHAAVLAGFFLWLAGQVGRGWTFAVALVVATVGVAPIPWENIVGGFQTQFYFLLGFSLLAIGGLGLAPAFSLRWWGGMLAALLAVLSMGSGLLCAVPVIVLVGLRLFEGAAPRRDAFATFTVALAIGIIGASLHTRVPYHESLHAHSIGMFLLYVARCLSWPLPQHPWLGFLFWLPWLTLAALRLRAAMGGRSRESRITPLPRAADFLLAVGLWVLAQIAAVSYSRGGTGELPASRYGDVLALGFIVSFCAFPLLAAHIRRVPLLAAVWLTPAALCLFAAGRDAWTGSLPGKKGELLAYERNVREFVLTDALTALEGQSIPFPSAPDLARILRRPPIRRLLPASVRAPLKLDRFASSAATPVPPPPHRRIHALLEAGEWRSELLPTGRGWWVFDTAGHFNRPGVTLEIIAVADGRVLSRIRPSKPPGNAWRAAYTPAPREPAVLRARTDSAARWLAFTEPVEMSALSHSAWRLTKHSRWLALAGALSAIAVMVSWALNRRGNPLKSSRV